MLGGRSSWLLVCQALCPLDAVSWVRYFSEENFSRRDFPLGVNMGSDSIPPKLFRMRI